MAVAGAFMRFVQRKRPQWGRAAVAGSCLVFLLGFDLLLEGLVFVRLGTYVFPGGSGQMLFAGRYYQFPLLYCACVVVTWWVWSCIRHFRDDQGRTIVERGMPASSADNRGSTGVRFLALAGVFQLSGLLLLCSP